MYVAADTRNPWLPTAFGGRGVGSYAKSYFSIPGQSSPSGSALMVSTPCGASMSGLGSLSTSSWLLIGAAALGAWFFLRKR